MQTIAARKTLVVPVPSAKALDFIAKHHRQGAAKPGKNNVAYGLTYNDELLAVAIFCNPRTRAKQENYTTELFRMAFKADVRVQGGASKLIKHYIRTKKPADLFTYQDTAGEATDVYAHAGLKLVEEAKQKTLLVRDGLTFASATNNRSDWFSMEQVVKHGPDKLLGTALGEVFKADGSRKSNVELFLEDCGYHLEKVPGDRVYAWINPHVKFYTYKIYSTTSEEYYYGRRTIRGQSVDVDSCYQDSYMGSGGATFKAWKRLVGEDSLRKEVLELFDSWSQVVKAEKKLIGELYHTDSDCLNVRPGGAGVSGPATLATLADCKIHGKTKFVGKSCCKCTVAKSLASANCLLHGETAHRGGKCLKCTAQNSLSYSVCSVHGNSKHRGELCLKCSLKSKLTYRECGIHGRTIHLGSTCRSCISEQTASVKLCPIHGESKHQGSTCRSCVAEAMKLNGICSIHGETSFRSDSCMKCTSSKATKLAFCETHGETTHQGATCLRCKHSKATTQSFCETHGLTTFVGGSCKKCASQKAVSLKVCPTHGETKHRGDNCYRCMAAQRNSIKTCSIHGETAHQGAKCRKCLASQR